MRNVKKKWKSEKKLQKVKENIWLSQKWRENAKEPGGEDFLATNWREFAQK